MGSFIKYIVTIFVAIPFLYILAISLGGMVDVISGEKTLIGFMSETFVNTFDKLFYAINNVEFLFVYTVIASILVIFLQV